MQTFVISALFVAFGYMLVRMLVTGEFYERYRRSTRKESPVSFWITWTIGAVGFMVAVGVCLKLA